MPPWTSVLETESLSCGQIEAGALAKQWANPSISNGRLLAWTASTLVTLQGGTRYWTLGPW
jgi:hypothetical protein